jgi:hypothetical protein
VKSGAASPARNSGPSTGIGLPFNVTVRSIKNPSKSFDPIANCAARSHWPKNRTSPIPEAFRTPFPDR